MNVISTILPGGLQPVFAESYQTLVALLAEDADVSAVEVLRILAVTSKTWGELAEDVARYQTADIRG